ncbi:phosphatase PAP2 family protein [Catellatospora sp. NPDC049609]|uniref:phosphatase PAP2 family protein n=1 Tax=Catellatospora sp. NPDC049609 TaxID=3155505 RepID=UPI0034164421
MHPLRESERSPAHRGDSPVASGPAARTSILRPLDAIVLGFLAVAATLVAIGHDHVPRWPLYLAGYAATAAVVGALLAAYARRPHDRVLTALRLSYPLVVAPVVYTMTGGTVLALRGRYLDAAMNRFESGVWGGHPALWLDAIVSRPLTELFYACYVSYYLYIVVPPVLLLLRRRLADLERLVTTVAAAVYTCYLGYLVVPVRGPVHSLAGQLDPPVLTGYLLAPAQQLLMAHADPAGTAFPSAHVAGAWAVCLAVRRIQGRAAFRWLLPLTIGLTLSVVYTRYHYTADVAAGLAVAFAADRAVTRCLARQLVGCRDNPQVVACRKSDTAVVGAGSTIGSGTVAPRAASLYSGRDATPTLQDDHKTVSRRNEMS